MGGSDQGGAVVAAGDVLGAGAAVERGFERRQVVGDGCDGDDVVSVDIQGVRLFESWMLIFSPPLTSRSISATSPLAAASCKPA
jgi:hypothetical protein